MPGFTTGISGRESNTRDVGLIPGTGRSPREGNGTPLQYCCLENFMDRGAWLENSMAMRLQRSDTTEHTHAHLMPWFLKQENYPVNNTVVNVLLLYSNAVVTKYLNPVNCNRLGLLVPHHLWNFPKFMFNELVMPSSHLILMPFLLLPSIFPSITDFPMSHLFASDDQRLELQTENQSFLWVFKVDFPLDRLVWSPCCQRSFQKSPPAPQFEGIKSLELFFVSDPALTTIWENWEDHSLDYTESKLGWIEVENFKMNWKITQLYYRNCSWVTFQKPTKTNKTSQENLPCKISIHSFLEEWFFFTFLSWNT